jgi:hypothetical protein
MSEMLCTDSPRIASTIIYRSIVLLQLLYRWQHQSQKYGEPLIHYIHSLLMLPNLQENMLFKIVTEIFMTGLKQCAVWIVQEVTNI